MCIVDCTEALPMTMAHLAAGLTGHWHGATKFQRTASHGILIFPFLDLSQQGSAGAYENWEWSWEANQTISNLKCLG